MKFYTLKTYVTVLLLMFASISFSQESNYRVVRGERPPVDLNRIPKDGYAQDKLRIKLAVSTEKTVSQKSVEETGFFGIHELDQLNTLLGVEKVNSVFPTFVMKSQFNERHKAWGFHLWYDLDFQEDKDILEMVNKYLSMPQVEMVEPVYYKRLIGYNPDGFVAVDVEQAHKTQTSNGKWIPNDPRLDEQWHYNNTGQQNGTPGCDIKLFEAWDINQGNPDVLVAVIDGGIQYNHPDLAENIWEEIGFNFITNTTNIDPHNHGTHVGGTISAVNNNGLGVAGIAGGTGSGDGVKLMTCEVFGPNNTQGGFDAAPVWAADNGAIISQNSWGYTSPDSYSQATLDAIDYFNANAGDYEGSVMEGGITIFAAGNDSQSGQWYPGCYSGAFAVAGMNNQDKVSWYTNYDTWVDISAPGGETNQVTERGVLSTMTGNSYGFYQGTSMACPHVSGVAALVLSHIPGVLTPEDLKEILLETTDDHYPLNPGYEGMLGAGRLNALNAMLEADAYIGGVKNPKNFKVEAISAHQIDLSWLLNEDSNPVIVAFNTESKFGTPVVGTQPGSQIEGGGTVLYVGSNLQFEHLDLDAVTTYYYKIWSYDQSTQEISTGRGGSAVTHCSTFDLPLEETFTAIGIPMCWSAEGVGNSDVWAHSNTNKSGGEMGEMKAKWTSKTGYSRLILPVLNTSGINLLTLKFRHFLDNYASGLTFLIQTSNDGENWNDGPWQMQSSGSNVGPEGIEVEITQNVNSETTYIAFVINGNHYNFNNWYIDDVEVDGIPTGAPQVTTSDATDITENSAVVGGNITSQGEAAVTLSGIVYHTKPGPKVNTPGAIVKYTQPLVTDGEYVIGLYNLNGGGRYYYRAFVENAIALTYGDQRILTTECGVITPTYEQGFDSGELPACWENVSNTNDPTQVWEFGSFSNGLSSSNYAYLNSDGYGSGKTQDVDLISPSINVANYSSVTISFKHYFRSYSSSKATFKYSTDEGATWQNVSVWNTTTSNPSTFEQTFNNLDGVETIRFAWNFTGSWAYYWCVDDVLVTGELAGLLPQMVTLDPIIQNGNTVELRGMINPNNTESVVQFQWGKLNFNDFQFEVDEIFQGDENIAFSHIVSNLEPGTSYAYRVRGENSFGESFGEVVEFTTWPVHVSNLSDSHVSIYPNPASSHINVVNGDNLTGELSIISVTGQTLHKEEIVSSNQQVGISQYNSGIYFLKITFANGDIWIGRFVKN